MKNLLLGLVLLVSGFVTAQDWTGGVQEDGNYSATSGYVVTLDGKKLKTYLNVYAVKGSEAIYFWMLQSGFTPNSQVTLSIIFNGDKSTLKTQTLTADADGDVKINALIDAQYILDNEVTVIYFKFKDLVFKADVGGIRDILTEAFVVSEDKSVKDPFGNDSDDPFQG